MTYTIKSQRSNLDHEDFVAAVTPLVASVVEDKGNLELRVTLKKTPKDFIESLGRGYGPLIIIPE